MRKLLILLTVFSLSACVLATRDGYDTVMATWVGSPENAVIEKWGIPTKSYTSDDKKFLTYRTNVTSYRLSYGVVVDDCVTTFIITNGIVTAYKGTGKNCLSKPQ